MPGELIPKGQQKKTQALNFKFNLRKPLAESNVKIVCFLTAFFLATMSATTTSNVKKKKRR